MHNFPEGIATFMSAMSDVTVGISIAVAVAIHNIPEGIAVSVPVYLCHGIKKKSPALVCPVRICRTRWGQLQVFHPDAFQN